MSRPASIIATVGVQILWKTGDYRYDEAGDILEMGPVLGGIRKSPARSRSGGSWKAESRASGAATIK